MSLKKVFVVVFIAVFAACSQDEDITTPRNLKEYLEVNTSLETDEVIACAASNKTINSIVYIFYYPVKEATEIRYYETDSINQDKTDFSLYHRKLAPQEDVFGGYLQKFVRTKTEKERWCLVTYKTPGKLHKSNPIRLKNKSKPTEWKDTVRIEYPQTLHPKFSWDDGIIAENEIYFEVVADANKKLLSGTYTNDKWFQYYTLDNVILNITPQNPPALILDDEYHFTMMGVSEDNWVNLILEKTFVAE